MSARNELAAWSDRLRRVAQRTLGDDLGAPDWQPDTIARFADELGHRRAVDPFLLAWRGRPDAQAPAPSPADVSEACLWSALTTGEDPSALLPDRPTRHAPLFAQPEDVVIEVWTETELASLHALWWHARKDDGLSALVADVASWHIEMLQPDNATNHPWGIHVFLTMHAQHNTPGAELYAQTLLHNCMVTMGRPDRFSAHVLADAADALEQAG